MEPVYHKGKLYNGESHPGPLRGVAEKRLIKFAELVARDRPGYAGSMGASGRNRFTRLVDRVFALARDYAPPLHRGGVIVSALLLFLYTQLVGRTVRLKPTGVRIWPDVPVPSVMAVWHGCAPSLFIAIIARRPSCPIAVMVSPDPRGDFLALLCRLLGLRVVRGDSEERGWEALAELAREIEEGTCVLVTTDGGGPARVAKVGAVALASATAAPLIAIGADCRPAVFMRRKWDRARIPVPFGRVVITLSRELHIPVFPDAESVEQARRELQVELDEMTRPTQSKPKDSDTQLPEVKQGSLSGRTRATK